MNINYTPLRITLTGQFAAALRLAACTDKRTMTAFLEVILPLNLAFAQAWKTLDAATVPSPEPVLCPAPAAHSPWVPVPVAPRAPKLKPELTPEETASMTPEQLAWRNSPENAKMQGWT